MVVARRQGFFFGERVKVSTPRRGERSHAPRLRPHHVKHFRCRKENQKISWGFAKLTKLCGQK
jgi:hypothetical protein